MRVVGGSARGRRLVVPPGSRIRPTSDRVREAIMNALWSRDALVGATVLDLFAGSGALGIEALSRGAERAVFVDDDPAARRAVMQNLAACGLEDRAEVVADRAEQYLARLGRLGPTGNSRDSSGSAGHPDGAWFDLSFCDPPYAFDGWAALLAALPVDLVVIESDHEVDLPSAWQSVRSSRYGATWVGFAERMNPGREVPRG